MSGSTATKEAPKQQQSPKEVGEVENSADFRFIEIHAPSMGIVLGTVIFAVLFLWVTFILQKCYRCCWERLAHQWPMTENIQCPPMVNDSTWIRAQLLITLAYWYPKSSWCLRRLSSTSYAIPTTPGTHQHWGPPPLSAIEMQAQAQAQSHQAQGARTKQTSIQLGNVKYM